MKCKRNAQEVCHSRSSYHPVRTHHSPLCKPRHRLEYSHLILLFKDYDCFYASVFEAENPKLKSLPLAVQQKQIIVTCNYEARRRGLHKLQLISEAKRICPDVIIVLGEDLTRFRDVSKDLAKYLASYVWSQRCERLGFDECWLDCTSMVDYNIGLLNPNSIENSYFYLDKEDPTKGFDFDATLTPGHLTTYESKGEIESAHCTGRVLEIDPLELRLRLGAHLALYLRGKLEERGFTATVGVSVNKLLSKLVGNTHKPNDQTTLMPPYNANHSEYTTTTTVSNFLDAHEIGKIPGVGFKLSQKLRECVLGRLSTFKGGFAPDTTNDGVKVADVRNHQGCSPELLQKILGGPGWPKDIGFKIHRLIHGVDESEVAVTKPVPTQISIEDSYVRLDTMNELKKELLKLSVSLIKRMRADLTESQDEQFTYDEQVKEASMKVENLTRINASRLDWLAIPRTLRLSTRPRPPKNADGTRSRAVTRISRSRPLPSFLLTSLPVKQLAERLVADVLIQMFKMLHSEPEWDLSLINIAVTNMNNMAGEGKGAEGQDISKMLQLQADRPLQNSPDHIVQETKLKRYLTPPDEQHKSKEPHISSRQASTNAFGSEDHIYASQESVLTDNMWQEATERADTGDDGEKCKLCGATMPAFALEAHLRFHMLPD
jgi:DNA polymerase iota